MFGACVLLCLWLSLNNKYLVASGEVGRTEHFGPIRIKGCRIFLFDFGWVVKKQ
jgi:hypothetical protein